MPKTRSTGTRASTPGRPRREETDEAIRDSALRLLRLGGPAAVTVEAIAAESGAAKTTIYRRYADREAVLRAALAAAIGRPGEPPGSSPRAKIRWALDETWRQMAEVLGPGGVAAILADSDPKFTDLFRRVLNPYSATLVDLIRADIAAGKLRADLDPDTAVTLLMGAFLGELLRKGRVSRKFGDRVTDLMWVAMAAPGAAD